MADISKVFLDGVSYDVKDATARTQLGNKADNVPTLTQASTRENIANGDTVPEALGKVMKYFDDLGDLAFEDSLDASDVGAVATTEKGVANGVAELDSTGHVPSAQLPSFVDDVLEYDSLSDFPATGETGKIYVTKDTNKTYRWSGSTYVEISESLALGNTSSTAYRGDYGEAAYLHSQSAHARADATKTESSATNGNIKIDGVETTVYTHPGSGTNPHGTTKADVGLDNVGNFKAVSTVANQGLSSTEQANARANIGIDDNFGGHEILDGSGTSMTQRSKMQFVGATLEVTDDSTNGKTVITSTAEKEFTGTEQQWEALTTAQKKTYDKVSLIDDYVDPSDPDADDIAYDNTTSGLSAINVQDAIDEVDSVLKALGLTVSNGKLCVVYNAT